MTNQVLIKKATLKDLDKFYKFFSRSIKTQFPEYSFATCRFFVEFESPKESFKKWLEKDQKLLLLATVNGKIVGYLLAASPYGGVSMANWIVVDDKYQRKGIGSKLLQEWEKEAKKQGAHKLHLWTDKRNVEFYKKRGFIYIGMVPESWFGADDCIFFKAIGEPKEKNYLREFLKKQKSSK